MRSTARFTEAIRSHRKGLVFVGAAAALMGAASSASAATVAPGHAPAVAAGRPSAPVFGRTGTLASLLDVAGPAGHAVAGPAGLGVAAAGHVAAPVADHAVAGPASHAAAHHVPAGHAQARRVAVTRAARPGNMSWNQVAEIQAHRADPALGRGSMPAADQLQPVPVYGPQEYMQLSPAQQTNAKTIVQQALAKKMGVRSAVVAVATAMQESQLNNISYGTSDSLGLFQQRPSCGWGTPQQIMNPAYATDAFLGALKVYQGNNPDWAGQPLYQAAQGVQGSAFPTAYAKWEAQASGLVRHITTAVTR